MTLSGAAWSPDGARLVVAGTHFVGGSQDTRLYINDGGRWTAIPGSEEMSSPSWSPDGASIAAASHGVIVVLPAAGGEARAITAGPLDGWPAWSPDGRRIAFGRANLTPHPAPLFPELMVTAADGSRPREIATEASEPAWSPDGRSIVFVSTKDRNGETCSGECFPHGELHIVGADGSGERRLTRTKADESGPAWSPDGTRIAYASNRNGIAGYEVFAFDPDGGCRTQLTWAASNAIAPVWQPGSGAAERGPCGGIAVPYTFDLDLGGYRLPGTQPLWLGPQAGTARVSGSYDRDPLQGEPPLIIYGECPASNASRCAGYDVALWRICDRNPARLDRPATSVQVVRGALVVGYRRVFQVLSGGTTTIVDTSARSFAPARIRALAEQLRPLGAAAPPARLARPRLPASALRALRHPERARRHDRALVRSDRVVLAALRRLHATSVPAPACAR